MEPGERDVALLLEEIAWVSNRVLQSYSTDLLQVLVSSLHGAEFGNFIAFWFYTKLVVLQ